MDILKIFTRQLSIKTISKPPIDENHGKQQLLRQFTLKEVAAHCTMSSCWMVINDKVYDLTEFIEYHPGGYELMLEYAGTDATNAFNEKPHTLEAADMLEKYLIGELVAADRMNT